MVTIAAAGWTSDSTIVSWRSGHRRGRPEVVIHAWVRSITRCTGPEPSRPERRRRHASVDARSGPAIEPDLVASRAVSTAPPAESNRPVVVSPGSDAAARATRAVRSSVADEFTSSMSHSHPLTVALDRYANGARAVESVDVLYLG
ncbi:MAG: hypothetical protein WKF80_07110 [Thermomicrobiales bacterium]